MLPLMYDNELPAWVLSKSFRFEASHQLKHHDGKCARLHGHSWLGRVYVRSCELVADGPKQGMVIDFADINKPLKALVETFLDHHHLNETLDMDSPTCENIARWIFERLYNHVPGLVAVRIEETCTSSCTYGAV
jgi:6-pyruvoyltetrahydropterin/6-carboxytetrahydropterin synthase